MASNAELKVTEIDANFKMITYAGFIVVYAYNTFNQAVKCMALYVYC